MSETQVQLKINGVTATATFATEGGLNVLSGSVLDRVYEVAEEVRRAEGVRFLILAATGKVFVAGANIKELKDLDAAGGRAMAERGNRAFDAIASLPCVTIARIHGAALGGGFEVALACDFRFAIDRAKVGLPEAALGLVPGWKGMSRVQALAGLAAVRQLTFSATPIAAVDARALSLIDGVAPDDAALDALIAEQMAALRRGGPHAIATVKQALATGDEVKAFGDCFAHDESREGMAAFVEKRAANWMEG
jgi:enoyl-CoA hydratase